MFYFGRKMSAKILLLMPRIPYPTHDGGSMAMYQCIEMYYTMGLEVTVLAMNTNKHFLTEQDYPPLFNKIYAFHAVNIDTDVKIKDAFLNLLGKQSYNISRFIHTKYSQKVKEILQLEKFDIIQFVLLKNIKIKPIMVG